MKGVLMNFAVQMRRQWGPVLLGLGLVCLLLGREQTVAAKDIDGAIQVGGMQRTYQVHVSDGSLGNEPYPLVIVLHGAGGDGKLIARYAGFNRLADQEGFIAVYPDGYRHIWAAGWNDSGQQKIDDVAFIRELIDHLAQQYPIDRKRVYATGMSNGGMLCHRLAIELHDRLAAIAPVGGTMPEKLAARTPGGTIPVLMIHGTDDRMVPYGGGALGIQTYGRQLGNLSVEDTAGYWAKANGCRLEPEVVKTFEDMDGDGTWVRVSRYKSADGAGDVFVYTVEGGGHNWPGSAVEERGGKQRRFLGKGRTSPEEARGKTTHEIDAATVIWQFFQPLHKS